MKIKSVFLFFLYFIFSIQTLIAQEDFEQQKSEYSYIFQISEYLALSFFEESPIQLDEAYFEKLIDSFPSSENYEKKLPSGHYIQTNANKNLQQTYYQSVKGFEVFAFNNAKDLIIQVYGKDGTPVENAEVRVDHKTLSYSKKHKAFVDKNSNEKGILKVNHEGFTAFYHLRRSLNSSFINRSAKKLAYTFPTKYVWLPIEYLAMLPVDGVKSIQSSYAKGRIWEAKRFFVKLNVKVGCWLGADDYRCDKDDRDFDVGYFVFNKPKFKPNDTLKGKTFIWDNKGKPIDEDLTVNFRKGYRNVSEIGKISPKTNGSYDLKLHLHDSLELDLDKSYSIELIDGDGNFVAQNRFLFQDYELKGINLDIQLSSTEQFKGQELEVTLNAKDENDLRILDANVEVQLLSLKSDVQAEDYVFVPDTLWSHHMKLETSKATKFSIPDTIFPKANVEYKLLAKLTTSDQEYIEATEQVHYFFESEKIKHQVVGDSILVEFLQNGKKIASDIRIESLDHFGNTNEVFNETTPFQFKIDALHKAYRFSANDLEKEVELNSISTGINAQLFRTKDSVFIKVSNPNQLDFHYHIFRKNKEIESGFGRRLEFSDAENKLIDYHLALNYVWAGKVLERNFVMPINDKNLNLKVNLPKLIYPGQKVDVEVEVVDFKKNPVENADVLAYGMTSKFDFTPDRIRNYSTKPKNRKLRNSFQLNGIEDQTFEEPLDIMKWNDLAQLHKLNYYQLIYPGKSIFKHEFELENQPTQFAPFVVDEGELVPVHIIYVNKKPVYFSDMTNVQPYSFTVDDRPVQVQLRTINHTITLDSIQFKKGQKTLFSMDVHQQYSDVKIEKASSILDESERNRLLQYVMPYRLINRGFAFVQNRGRFHLLQSSPNFYSSNKFLGPIHNQKVKFIQNNQYELDFNLESYFEYEFQPKHLKQSPFSKSSYPSFLDNQEIPSFYDLALTQEKMSLFIEMDLLGLKKKKKLFSYPNVTSINRGTLEIKHQQNSSNIVLINLNNKDDFRVYQGSIKKIYDLKPGDYRLIFIFPNQDYTLLDAIQIQPNGTNFYNIYDVEIRKADSFSDTISNLITDFLINNNQNNAEFYQRQLKQTYQDNVQYMGDSHLFSGVVSGQDGLPLPGVNIMVSGTNYGTQTDFDGNFRLRVPVEFSKVELSYIGFERMFFSIIDTRFQQITLVEDEAHLDEVVVMGYGRSTKKVFTERSQIQNEILTLKGVNFDNQPNASLIQVLSGQAAGVQIIGGNGQPGQSSIVRIRGNSTVNSSGTPLYVVNGVPYDGDFLTLSADLIQDVTILKDASATAIYGSRGKNGVVLITTSQTDLQIEEETELPPDFAIESSEANSMRTNFKDEAFWKPNLTTNKEGKVNFSITYPDDVTSWDTHFYAATESQQTGQVSQNVKSYRPLVSQLSIPRFLIKGDSVSGIGKVKNYVKDSIAIQTQFSINKEIKFSKEKQIFDFEADDLRIVAKNTDSLRISYQVTRKDNDYFDGEELKIPVFPRGMKKAEGEFRKLQKNDTLDLNFKTNLGEAKLNIKASLNSILEQELEVVINYLHDCNEQIASRLKAQLIKLNIYNQQNRTFEDEKDIKKLIRLLQKNQQSNSLWGWWANSSPNLWASLNVVEALLMADRQEFNVNWDKEELKQKLSDRLFLENTISTRIHLLRLLDLLETDVNYREEIENLLKKESLSVVEKFQLWELFQKHGGDVPLRELFQYQKESALGNWYMEAEEKLFFHPYKNSVQASLIAYRILSKIKNQEEASDKIKDYLIMQRNFGGYANTFESMQVIETLLDDVSNPENTTVNYQVQLNNGVWETLDSNSHTQTFKASDVVRITNSGELPIYMNYVQTYFDQTPIKREDVFEVDTYFENEFGEKLQSNEVETGKPVSLKVKLDAKKQANYFMLEVPIPSGFSYHDKKKYRNETHREYAKDKTYIFIEKLESGKNTFSIELMPKYQGDYQLNPAKAQLMYFEQFYGNNELKKIKVVE